MRWLERRQNFRNLLTGRSCVYPASVFDPVSARIAASLGFECGMFAGSVASMTVLGDPDHMVLTLSELSAQTHRICRGSPLPVLVDADHGYGNALNVMRTVEELENAGVAGLSIEDTELPRSFGRGESPSLVSLEEGIGKMKSAVAARQSHDLVIAARTSAVSLSGLDDAVKRVCAYQDLGVDALFLVGVQETGQLEALARVAKLPLILGGISGKMMDRHHLASCGVRICLQGHQPILAAYAAVHQTMQSLREGAMPEDLSGLPGKAWLAHFTREDTYAHRIRNFLE